MSRVLLAAALVLASCAKPSRVSTSLTFSGGPPNLTVITVRMKNLDVRASTPLRVNVSIEKRESASWGKPESVMHPSAFVLKKSEEQIIRTSVRLAPGTVRATLTVHEQESNRQIEKKTFETKLP